MVSIERQQEASIPEMFSAVSSVGGYAGNSAPKEQLAAFIRKLKTDSRFKNSGHNLLLNGPRRSWKTYLGSWALMTALDMNLTAKYMTMPEMVEGVFDKRYPSSTFREPQLFFLDELVAENNAFFATALSRFLTIRKDSGKLTLFATRLNQAELRAVYGDDSVDLLRDTAELVSCTVNPAHEARRKSRLLEEV